MYQLFLGWPFAALLGVPIAYDMLVRRKKYVDFVIWSTISALVILLPMISTDSSLYGRFTIAPYNIVKYNVLGGAGPNLYGTEPFSFYFINGFVNFNLVWVSFICCHKLKYLNDLFQVLALSNPLAIALHHFFVPAKNRCTLSFPYWLSLSPMYLWLLVFLFQEHKEER